jgi:preprotein translocase subunit SecY
MNRLQQIWKAKEVRNKILFVLAMLFVYRVAAHIPIPGIDPSGLKDFFANNQIFGLVNVFSGGGLSSFSIVMLGVGPYITASIILQLLVMIVPKLEEIQKEGESGQKRINQYTRILTVPLAVIQAYSFMIILQRQGQNLLADLSWYQWTSALVVATAGTMLLVWIGELITEKKVGNGVSLIIFAGIVARLPQVFSQVKTLYFAPYDPSKLPEILGILAAAWLVTVSRRSNSETYPGKSAAGMRAGTRKPTDEAPSAKKPITTKPSSGPSSVAWPAILRACSMILPRQFSSLSSILSGMALCRT